MSNSLSIVIQTKNEEKHLPILLRSIKEQNFEGEYELIVADADSTDATQKIAKRFGCRIVSVGNHANGINQSVNAAKNGVILFLDADTVLPQKFLEINYSRFVKSKLDLASCYIDPLPRTLVGVLMYELANFGYFLFKKTKPAVPGFCFIITKRSFHELGGFDESIRWFDDLAFSNKLDGKINYDFLPIRVKLSTRRAEKIGWPRLAFIMSVLAIHRLLGKNYNGGY